MDLFLPLPVLYYGPFIYFPIMFIDQPVRFAVYFSHQLSDLYTSLQKFDIYINYIC